MKSRFLNDSTNKIHGLDTSITNGWDNTMFPRRWMFAFLYIQSCFLTNSNFNCKTCPGLCTLFFSNIIRVYKMQSTMITLTFDL